MYRRHVAALAACCLLALAACSDDDSGATGSSAPATAGTSAGADTSAPAATENAPVASEPAVTDGSDATEPDTTADTTQSTSSPQGGTIVIRLGGEPPTLDPQKTNDPLMWNALLYTGGSLVTRDPATGALGPGLATSWTVSADGLHYEFTLRDDVRFHNGDPLTADDYAFTFNRAIDPATQSPVSGTILQGLAAASAPDATTLVLDLSSPNAALLLNLSDPVFAMPLDRAYVESVSAEELARAPIGVGPYRVAEWDAGNRIVLTRNADYTWGPDAAHPGPANIETIEMPFVTDYSSALAGLEAGDIDVLSLQSNDVAAFEADGGYTVVSSLAAGIDPLIHINVSRAPFDDIAVREALNLAVDRDVIIKVAVDGAADPQLGPLSPAVAGYDAAAGEHGWQHDADEAVSVLEAAGWSRDGDGTFAKDGQQLAFTLTYASDNDERRRIAEVLQQQYGEIGIDITIEAQESGVFTQHVVAGDYDLAIDGWAWPDSSLLYGMFHSSMIGALNQSQVNDPDLDALLDEMFTAPDADTNLRAAAAVQEYIVEQAYIVPLYTKRNYVAIRSEIGGVAYSEVTARLDILQAYVAG